MANTKHRKMVEIQDSFVNQTEATLFARLVTARFEVGCDAFPLDQKNIGGWWRVSVPTKVRRRAEDMRLGFKFGGMVENAERNPDLFSHSIEHLLGEGARFTVGLK